MTSNVLRFPTPGGQERKPVLAPAPVLESFDPARTAELLAVASHSLSSAEALLDFVHENRDLARHAGIETLAVELVAIMQGDRFARVVDALEESVRNGEAGQLTPDGLATLRRVEALLAEASSNVRKFTEGDFTVMEIVEARARREADYQKAYLDMEERRLEGLRKELGSRQTAARRQADTIAAMRTALGQTRSSYDASAPSSQRSSDQAIWIPFAIFGAIAVTATIIALVAGKK